jgi:hypothetical protein
VIRKATVGFVLAFAVVWLGHSANQRALGVQRIGTSLHRVNSDTKGCTTVDGFIALANAAFSWGTTIDGEPRCRQAIARHSTRVIASCSNSGWLCARDVLPLSSDGSVWAPRATWPNAKRMIGGRNHDDLFGLSATALTVAVICAVLYFVLFVV